MADFQGVDKMPRYNHVSRIEGTRWQGARAEDAAS